MSLLYGDREGGRIWHTCEVEIHLLGIKIPGKTCDYITVPTRLCLLMVYLRFISGYKE